MINFSENDLRYIEMNIDENIKILELKTPNDLEQYVIEELLTNGYRDINSLIKFKNDLEFANESKNINKQVEEYCIWIMGMWLHLRFNDEVEDLNNISYANDEYCSIYEKIIRDKDGNKRYCGDGIIFYDAE